MNGLLRKLLLAGLVSAAFSVAACREGGRVEQANDREVVQTDDVIGVGSHETNTVIHDQPAYGEMVQNGTGGSGAAGTGMEGAGTGSGDASGTAQPGFEQTGDYGETLPPGSTNTDPATGGSGQPLPSDEPMPPEVVDPNTGIDSEGTGGGAPVEPQSAPPLGTGGTGGSGTEPGTEPGSDVTEPSGTEPGTGGSGMEPSSDMGTDDMGTGTGTFEAEEDLQAGGMDGGR